MDESEKKRDFYCSNDPRPEEAAIARRKMKREEKLPESWRKAAERRKRIEKIEKEIGRKIERT